MSKFSSIKIQNSTETQKTIPIELFLPPQAQLQNAVTEAERVLAQRKLWIRALKHQIDLINFIETGEGKRSGDGTDSGNSALATTNSANSLSGKSGASHTGTSRNSSPSNGGRAPDDADEIINHVVMKVVRRVGNNDTTTKNRSPSPNRSNYSPNTNRIGGPRNGNGNANANTTSSSSAEEEERSARLITTEEKTSNNRRKVYNKLLECERKLTLLRQYKTEVLTQDREAKQLINNLRNFMQKASGSFPLVIHLAEGGTKSGFDDLHLDQGLIKAYKVRVVR